MEDAAPLFGLAAMLWGTGFVIFALSHWWLSAKRLDRASKTHPSSLEGTAAIEARLARIEQAVDTIAVELERVGEAQRFAARLHAEDAGSGIMFPSPAREDVPRD